VVPFFSRLRITGDLCQSSSEGKSCWEHAIDEDDDMLSAMARELVERNGIGETADAVWKALNTEHQRRFPATAHSDNDAAVIEAPGVLIDTHSNPSDVVEVATDSNPIFIFGQRPESLSGRRRRARPPVPEQPSLFSFS
jgi:hypothetical protein